MRGGGELAREFDAGSVNRGSIGGQSVMIRCELH